MRRLQVGSSVKGQAGKRDVCSRVATLEPFARTQLAEQVQNHVLRIGPESFSGMCCKGIYCMFLKQRKDIDGRVCVGESSQETSTMMPG